jgi:mRNA-degrading endonuclease RelE of RelBE toxin-antitoxin system
MEFLIADTFTDSLARLTGDEQKATKTTAFDLQMNPANPGMNFHKLDRAKDKNFWSVRVNKDVRLIVHKTQASLLLCYVDHHDAAYDWAERRKLETHPKTGAAQLVEIRERVQDIVIPTYVEAPAAPKEKPKLYANLSDETLFAYGIPAEWLNDVRNADEDSVLQVSEHLPVRQRKRSWNLLLAENLRSERLPRLHLSSIQTHNVASVWLRISKSSPVLSNFHGISGRFFFTQRREN